jgi:hypothetical protein
MILQRGDASDQHAVALGDVSYGGFERDDALGVGDAHGALYRMEPSGILALSKTWGDIAGKR